MNADDLKTYPELAALWPNMPAQEEPVEFNDDDVPPELQGLIPYARMWGIPDDGYRTDVLEETPPSLRMHMQSAVLTKKRELMAWLAGPEAKNPNRSEAFSVFVALLIASEV